MAIPVLNGIAPASGHSSGDDLVKIIGTDFSQKVAVRFGDFNAEIIVVRESGGLSVADVRTPSHAPGFVDVTLTNLDENSEPVPGEQVVLPDAYRFLRSQITTEADLTRLVRTLLRELKKQIVENTSIAVSVDYDDTTGDGLDVVAMSKLPSLVLSGPRIEENRFFSVNESREVGVAGPYGPEIIRHRPPYTLDLNFTITVASDHTVELLNLMAAVATFLNRNRWIEMPRTPGDPGQPVRWEMDPDGEFRTRLDEGDDVRVFTCGLTIRGFDIDEGWPIDIGRAVDTTQLDTSPIEDGGLP
jgi:hypothetical protein